MKYSNTIFITAILLSIALFILGQYVFVNLFEFFEPRIDGIAFKIVELDGRFSTSILFSLTLALIPILIVSLWRFAPIISTIKRVASVFSILICIIIAIRVRHQQVKTFFNRVIKNVVSSNHNQDVSYPIDPVNFVYYMFAGLCIGCLVSYFLFRQKKI